MERGIEFSLSFNKDYINLMLWTERRANGDWIQIPLDKVEELIINLTNLNKEN